MFNLYHKYWKCFIIYLIILLKDNKFHGIEFK